MLASYKRYILVGTPVRALGLDLPRPEEVPPASWWSADCDHSLVVGILKHGEYQIHTYMYNALYIHV